VGTTLTAAGSNFVQGSEIEWNGTPLATLYVSTSSLTAPLSSSDVQTAATIQISVVNPASAGGRVSNALPLLISAQVSPNPVPVVSSLSPASAATGSVALTVTVTGSGFVAGSTVDWNGTALTSSYVSATTLTAQVPASDLAAAGSGTITVVNPTPGGGTSNGATFSVAATGVTPQIAVNLDANSLAWDPVNQVIYLSLPSTDGANGNTVQILNPVTGALGASAFVGSEPDLLSVSSTSKYLYVGLDGASNVQVMTLPGLGTGITIPLGADSFFGPYYAMDVEAAPAGADGTVAVVRGTPDVSPEEEGGVVIYDSGVARPNVLCGFSQSGCSVNGGDLFDSIQWNGTGTEMFAANNEDTGFDFYTIPVTSAGFGAVTDYGGVLNYFYENIHYDTTTQQVYDDGGQVINPVNGTIEGTFAASGLMVPDGTVGKAFFIGQLASDSGTDTYTIESFDIQTFTPIDTVTVTNVIGTPTHLIRWGTNGLAFTTTPNGANTTSTAAVYLISGSIVNSSSSSASVAKTLANGNVQRTWPVRQGLFKQKDPKAELKILGK
jgi:hypothetical protein